MTAKRWLLNVIASAMLTIAMTVSPALAHKDHHKKPVAEQQPATEMHADAAKPAIARVAGAGEEQPVDRSKMSTMERLADWLGRLHPIIVHFPIAFFPAALLTATVGRRRPAFAAPVQFLIIAGGVVAPVAALLGWLDAGFNPTTDDWLLQPHRWLGTGLGIGGPLIAWWAWRNPGASGTRTMIGVLTAVTLAIAVQGWFGGAMVHGADHLNW